VQANAPAINLDSAMRGRLDLLWSEELDTIVERTTCLPQAYPLHSRVKRHGTASACNSSQTWKKEFHLILTYEQPTVMTKTVDTR
jgi:hypothetical protein